MKPFGELRKKENSSLIPPPILPILPAPDRAPPPPWPNPHLMLLWATLTSLGAFLLSTHILLMSLFALDMAYLGLIFISIGAIGLSEGISRTLTLPQYNLWKKIKHFAKKHLFVSSCITLGILMVNPWITLLGAFLGFWIEKIEPNFLINANARRLEFFKKLQQFFSNDNLQSLLDDHLEFIRDNSLPYTCLLIGACLGLGIYFLLLPWLLSPALILSDLLIDFALNACHFFMQSLIGGYLPGLGLIGIASFMGAVVCLTPPVLLAVSAGWLGFKCGEALLSLYTLISNKAYEKGREANHYVTSKYSQFKTVLALAPAYTPSALLALPKTSLFKYTHAHANPANTTDNTPNNLAINKNVGIKID